MVDSQETTMRSRRARGFWTVSARPCNTRAMSIVQGAVMPILKPASSTSIQYKGYRIEVIAVGKGFRASIFPPNATRPLADSPCNLEKSEENDIVAEAKRVVDAHLRP